MSKEENTELLALKRKKKRVENAINSQSKRLKTTKTNGGNTSSIDRTLKNSKEALVRIDAEIKKCEPKSKPEPIKREKDYTYTEQRIPKWVLSLIFVSLVVITMYITGVI